jgi:hypothetical protein
VATIPATEAGARASRAPALLSASAPRRRGDRLSRTTRANAITQPRVLHDTSGNTPERTGLQLESGIACGHRVGVTRSP